VIFGYYVQDAGYEMPDARCRIQFAISNHLSPITDHWLSVTGYWLLVASRYFLIADHSCHLPFVNYHPWSVVRGHKNRTSNFTHTTIWFNYFISHLSTTNGQ